MIKILTFFVFCVILLPKRAQFQGVYIAMEHRLFFNLDSINLPQTVWQREFLTDQELGNMMYSPTVRMKNMTKKPEDKQQNAFTQTDVESMLYEPSGRESGSVFNDDSNRNKELYSKYVQNKFTRFQQKQIINTLIALVFLLESGLNLGFFVAEDTHKYQIIRDMWNPVSNGNRFTSKLEWQYDADKCGKFAPNILWYVNISLLVVIACTCVRSLIIPALKNKKSMKKQKRIIDAMNELSLLGCTYKLNGKSFEHVIKACPEIIANMSADERAYFDMLIDGDIDVINNKQYRDIAVHIMAGHLREHPKDLQKIMNAINDKTLPAELLSDFVQREYK